MLLLSIPFFLSLILFSVWIILAKQIITENIFYSFGIDGKFFVFYDHEEEMRDFVFSCTDRLKLIWVETSFAWLKSV